VSCGLVPTRSDRSNDRCTRALRVVSGAPHNVEHALTFLVTGIAFGLGYELRMTVSCAAAIVFCAALELLQLAVPGRFAWFARRLGEGSRTHEPGMVDTK
jgi:hypothetical protein